MTQQGRGVVLLAAPAARAVEWVRGGVVPCHVLEHAAWSIIVPAATTSVTAAPYDDALTVLASRHAGPRLTPAIGLFVIDDTAVLTARSGRSPVRWALRSADREIVRGPRLPPLAPEDLHRTLAGNPAVREVPIREVRALWGRTDLTHVEWLVEVATVLGLPGSRVLDGADDSLGPVISPDESAVRAFESVVKDVHQ
ncbi:hypothetical protein ACQBJO_09920 [Janibacter sp. G349]|jgi:hypothetical protein|uniref:hypothetical protein n=1 Tax=unclassified Janibacter TaxID=2649294 RepID=UPI0020CBD002|nr:hypothetical protein [Janibacter sp. CX7]UTT64908.1 hypothetical protein NMQ01_09185 [Janibacter sp. CX7]